MLKSPLPNLTSASSSSASKKDYGVEVNVSKAAVEPVWFLPGVARRFGIDEGASIFTIEGYIAELTRHWDRLKGLLRRALFEDGGGQFPELLTRPDLKVFLPPMFVLLLTFNTFI